MGVVIPGARAAVETTRNQKVGVIGTDATVQSGMYTKVIQSMAPDIEVIEKACPLFVPLVEEGFKEHVYAVVALMPFGIRDQNIMVVFQGFFIFAMLPACTVLYV